MLPISDIYAIFLSLFTSFIWV